MGKLTQEQYEVIAAKYNEIVIGNTDETWNAAAAVLADTELEVYWEIADVAYDLGFKIAEPGGDYGEQPELDKINDYWYDNYRGKLKIVADKFPINNNEDGGA